MEKEKSSPLTCLLMYHPNDRQAAKWLKRTLKGEGFTCYLLFEVAGADLHTEMFRCADDADCVISLITKTLFDDETRRKFHTKVYSRLRGEKYIAVRMNIEDTMFYCAAGGFLEGCHVLAPEKMTDVEFRECLVSEINAVARRIPIIPLSDNHFQLESDISPDMYIKSLNIPTSSNSDEGTFNVPQLSLGPTAVSEIFEGTQQASASQFSLKVVASEDENTPETSISSTGLNENLVVVANNSSGSSSIPLSSEEKCSKVNHFVWFLRTSVNSVLKNVKALVKDRALNENNETPQEKQIQISTQVSESSSEKQNIRDQTPNAAFSECSNKSYANLMSDQTVSSEERKHVQQSTPTCLMGTSRPNAYFDSFETEPERTYHNNSKGRPPKQLGDRHTSCQLLDLGSFGKFTPHEKPIYRWKTMILRQRPNRFLRSPFLLPILSIEKLPVGYRIATPFMTHGNLGQLISSANASIQIETEHSSWNLCLLRIIYQMSEAIAFLHDRNVFHGNITPNNILIDEQKNARLGDYGFIRDSRFNVPAHNTVSTCVSTRTAKDADMFMFGITLLQILKCTNDRQFVADELRVLTVGLLPEAEAIATVERHIEGNLWQLGHEETLHLCKIVLQCLSKSHTASMCDIKAHMKEFISTLQLLPIPGTFPSHNCVYCMVETPKQGFQARSSICPQKCVFLNICPSCMPTVCSSCLSCPQHDSQISPPFGGKNSCALIISGRDQNEQETQNTFYKDAFQIATAVAHPHIMAIPWNNIYHISPWENSTEAEINRVVYEIVTQKKPDFFLLYYSGHHATESASSLDVSDRQGGALDVAKLQSLLLQPLVRTCSRLLLILDCCYAASLWPLLHQELYENDSHISFHTMWPSCGRRSMSNIPPNEEQSLFTKCFVTGIKGGRECPCPRPDDTPSCPICQMFRKAIDENHCVTKKILEEFVNQHMQSTFKEDRDDCQRPVIVESRRDSDPVIAYYRNQALYRFHYESPKGQNFMRKICELDSLGYDVDDVLLKLYNQLKDECLPNQLDHLTLEILRRESDDSAHELSEFSDIINAVFEDADSLYVSIRTDGEHFGNNKWVACFCDEAQTEDTVRSLLALERNRQMIERHANEVAILEVNPTWKPAEDDSVFDKTFRKCWNSFLSLKEQRQLQPGSDSYLKIEIREKLSMFSIVHPNAA